MAILKIRFAFLLFLGLNLTAYSQSQEIETFHTQTGKKVETQDSAYFVRKIVPAPVAGLAELTEHYLDGTLKKHAHIEHEKGVNLYEGEVKTYHPNGQLESVEWYEKAVRKDTARYYYFNGQLRKEIIYSGYQRFRDRDSPFRPDTVLTYYEQNGAQSVVQGSGFARESQQEDYEEGAYKSGFKDGEWKGTFRDGKCSFTESYERGILLSGTTIEENGDTHHYTDLGTPPEFPHGFNHLRQLVAQNFVYPREALKAGVSGLVEISFVVDRNGEMVDVKVSKDLGHGTGAAAIQALKRVKKQWTPGHQRGIPVRVQYALPLRLASLQ